MVGVAIIGALGLSMARQNVVPSSPSLWWFLRLHPPAALARFGYQTNVTLLAGLLDRQHRHDGGQAGVG